MDSDDDVWATQTDYGLIDLTGDDDEVMVDLPEVKTPRRRPPKPEPVAPKAKKTKARTKETQRKADKGKKKRKEKGATLWSATIRNLKTDTWDIRGIKYMVWKKLVHNTDYTTVVIAREYGGEDATNEHVHLFLRTSVPKSMMEFKTDLCWDLRLSIDCAIHCVSVEKVRSEKNFLKYMTKEDYKVCHRGADYGLFHTACRMYNFIARNKKFRKTDNYILTLPTQYARLFREAHSDYWTQIAKGKQLDSEALMAHYNAEVIADVSQSSKIGQYIYGPSGTGKSVSTYTLAGTDYYEFTEQSEKFPLSGYSGEDVIVMDEATEDFWHSHRNTILKTTSGLNFPVTHKGSATTTHPAPKLFLITSNFDPPAEEPFVRRFNCIYTGE